MSFFSLGKRGHASVFAIVTMLVTSSFQGCGFDGGLNQNQHTPGNEENGVSLSLGDIAIDPSGTYFLSSSEEKLILGNIDSGRVEVLPGITDPHRLVFGGGDLIFVTSFAKRGQLIGYDIRTKETVWKKDIDIFDFWLDTLGVSFPLLQISEDEQQLVITEPDSLQVVSASDGRRLHDISFSGDVIVVDLHPVGDRIIVTLDHVWEGDGPLTKVVVYSMSTEEKTTITVPNCSDELVLAEDGDMGFLAPTRCAQDPVSVIDFKSGEFVRNLPGFGPVALAPSGETAIAFMDLDNLDEALFDSPDDIPTGSKARYHLMFIDINSLEFDTMEVGDNLPRYAMTPDGRMLLVDSTSWFSDARIRMLDIAMRRLEMVAGPDVRLNNFVITSDSKRALLLDDGLYDLSVPELVVESVALMFTPKNINITPDDSRLLLRETSSLLWVYDIASRQVIREIDVQLTHP